MKNARGGARKKGLKGMKNLQDVKGGIIKTRPEKSEQGRAKGGNGQDKKK